MSQKPCKYLYLKDWINHPDPRPIILECVSSRSGMSMSVYDRDRKVFSIGGSRFDRIGCAIAEFLENVYRAELDANQTAITGKYGAKLLQNGHVILEGMSGESSMRDIGKAIGLKIRVYDAHSSTMIHITRAEGDVGILADALDALESIGCQAPAFVQTTDGDTDGDTDHECCVCDVLHRAGGI